MADKSTAERYTVTQCIETQCTAVQCITVRCVALDMDRTTLNREGRLSENNRKALERVIASGVHIIIASGRAFETLPRDMVELPGVGRKTATLFLADAYGVPGVTVDTHVFRISKRIGWAEGKNPVQVEKELMKVLPREHWNRLNFQLIYHGRSVCTARKAHCGKCALNQWCEKRV